MTLDTKEQLYYIQDSRRGAVVGNSASWWRAEGRGYTCDIHQAGKYTIDDRDWRDTDRPWKCEEIDKLVQWHIDVQDLHRKPLPKSPHTRRENEEL